jgi:hypothetical protein
MIVSGILSGVLSSVLLSVVLIYWIENIALSSRGINTHKASLQSILWWYVVFDLLDAGNPYRI